MNDLEQSVLCPDPVMKNIYEVKAPLRDPSENQLVCTRDESGSFVTAHMEMMYTPIVEHQVVIGGLVDAPTHERLECISTFRCRYKPL